MSPRIEDKYLQFVIMILSELLLEGLLLLLFFEGTVAQSSTTTPPPTTISTTSRPPTSTTTTTPPPTSTTTTTPPPTSTTTTTPPPTTTTTTSPPPTTTTSTTCGCGTTTTTSPPPTSTTTTSPPPTSTTTTSPPPTSTTTTSPPPTSITTTSTPPCGCGTTTSSTPTSTTTKSPPPTSTTTTSTPQPSTTTTTCGCGTTTTTSPPPTSTSTPREPITTPVNGCGRQIYVEKIDKCFYRVVGTRNDTQAKDAQRCSNSEQPGGEEVTPELCLPPPNMKPKKWIELLKEETIFSHQKMPEPPAEVYIGCVCYDPEDKPCKYGKENCNSNKDDQCQLAGVETCSDISCDKTCTATDADVTKPKPVYLKFDYEEMDEIKYWKAGADVKKPYFCCYTPNK